jgi:hypothetical protein
VDEADETNEERCYQGEENVQSEVQNFLPERFVLFRRSFPRALARGIGHGDGESCVGEIGFGGI